MEKRKVISRKLMFYSVVLILSAILAAHFLSRAKTSQQTLDQFATAQEIEENMPIGFIVRRFGLSEQEIYKELRLPSNRWNRRHTISQVCRKNKLDCPTVIDSLNRKISR